MDFVQLRPRELRRFRVPANHVVPTATASLGDTQRGLSSLVRGRYSALQRPVIPALKQHAFANPRPHHSAVFCKFVTAPSSCWGTCDGALRKTFRPGFTPLATRRS